MTRVPVPISLFSGSVPVNNVGYGSGVISPFILPQEKKGDKQQENSAQEAAGKHKLNRTLT